MVCLDGAYDQKGFTKTERRTIAGIITDFTGELVAARQDAQMKRIYNRYSQSDYDREEAANLKGVQDMLEDALGLDLGEELDVSSPDEFFARAQEKIQERQAEFDAERQAHEDRRAKRAKSAKQLAQEARQQTQQRQLSQSIREVYRKLVSALHPDRETDPTERARKTALMQRVNQAYDKNNLLQLLELQLELEHIDQFALKLQRRPLKTLQQDSQGSTRGTGSGNPARRRSIPRRVWIVAVRRYFAEHDSARSGQGCCYDAAGKSRYRTRSRTV